MTRVEAEKLLGLDKPYDKTDLRKAVRAAMKKYHPDRAAKEGLAAEEAQSFFVKIQPAQKELEILFNGEADDYKVTPSPQDSQPSNAAGASYTPPSSSSQQSQRSSSSSTTSRATARQSSANPSTRGRGSGKQQTSRPRQNNQGNSSSGRDSQAYQAYQGSQGTQASWTSQGSTQGRGAASQSTGRGTTSNTPHSSGQPTSQSPAGSSASSQASSGSGGLLTTLLGLRNTVNLTAVACVLVALSFVSEFVYKAIDGVLAAIGLGSISLTSTLVGMRQALMNFFQAITYKNLFTLVFVTPIYLVAYLLFSIFVIALPFLPVWLLWRSWRRRNP